MLDKQGLDQILRVVSERWMRISNDPGHKALQGLPDDFWMNAAGGRAGSGKWLTVILYTENDTDAETFRQVLQKWQMKGARSEEKGMPDLIQIGKNKNGRP